MSSSNFYKITSSDGKEITTVRSKNNGWAKIRAYTLKYKDEIEPNLSEGKALSFSHAAAIYWKWIEAPNNVDLIMVAPKGPGSKVRETYLDNFGTPSIVAVEQDFAITGFWVKTILINHGYSEQILDKLATYVDTLYDLMNGLHEPLIAEDILSKLKDLNLE